MCVRVYNEECSLHSIRLFLLKKYDRCSLVMYTSFFLIRRNASRIQDTKHKNNENFIYFFSHPNCIVHISIIHTMSGDFGLSPSTLQTFALSFIHSHSNGAPNNPGRPIITAIFTVHHSQILVKFTHLTLLSILWSALHKCPVHVLSVYIYIDNVCRVYKK